MKTVQLTKFQAADGTLFDSEEACAKHESLTKILDSIMKPLVKLPKDPNLKFANGEGYIQQDPAKVTQAKINLLNHFNKGREDKMGFGFLGRYLSDSCSIAYFVWQRLTNTDADGREWGQAFYANNPEKAKQQSPYTGG